jgi:hypothetical protein
MKLMPKSEVKTCSLYYIVWRERERERGTFLFFIKKVYAATNSSYTCHW